MKQLKMCRVMIGDIKTYELPFGYTVENYKSEEEKAAWIECCRGGRLIDENAGIKAFDSSITAMKEIDPYKDVFFLKHNGVIVGTATGFVFDSGDGDLHMVGIRTDHRGKGLCKYLISAVLQKLHRDGVKRVFLTTDEFRVSAIKSYLTAGFLPVDCDTDMKERWKKVISDLCIKSVAMYDADIVGSITLYADQ